MTARQDIEDAYESGYNISYQDVRALLAEHDAELAAIAQPTSPVQASPVTNADIDAAREALDSLDDFARMTVGVNAIGPRGVLERFIANVAAIAQPANPKGLK